jgi:hypothetical protein
LGAGKKICHPDGGVAGWRDLLFLFQWELMVGRPHPL